MLLLGNIFLIVSLITIMSETGVNDKQYQGKRLKDYLRSVNSIYRGYLRKHSKMFKWVVQWSCLVEGFQGDWWIHQSFLLFPVKTLECNKDMFCIVEYMHIQFCIIFQFLLLLFHSLS